MSDEPEMVERVARAMDEAVDQFLRHADVGDAGWLEINLHKLRYVKARAAIAAMREPTLAMQRSGIYAQHGVAAKDVWDAMIAAALGEKKP